MLFQRFSHLKILQWVRWPG